MANRLYGIGEPVTHRVLRGDYTAKDAVGIMHDLGVTAFREWMGLSGRTCFVSETQTDEEVCRAFDETFSLCEQYDIEVTGIGGFYIPKSLGITDNGLPKRDLTPGSAYQTVLEATEKSWETLAKRFPYVKQWETGNEWNGHFLHPAGWKSGDPYYGLETAMIYACDLMYVSARGIRRGNPDAKVVSFSPVVDGENNYIPDCIPRGFGIAFTLECMYNVIQSGKSFSTNTDDYFDMVAWHPYLSTQMGYAPVRTEYPAKEMYLQEEMPDAVWKSYNDMAYHVMAKHGDGHKKVLLTEFGFSDCYNEEREAFQASLISTCFELLKQMPYVKTCHFFRLFEEENERVVSNGFFTYESEAKFGIVKEAKNNFEYRKKALALQKVYKEL